MLNRNVTVFDSIAITYDASFSNTLIGAQQRILVHQHLQHFLKDKAHLKILEINCGTGDDALWLSSLGHEVMATDASANMIAIAEQKTHITTMHNKPVFIQCDFEKLYAKFKNQKFDLIFSNFSGLNCLGPGQLQVLGSDLHALLTAGGHIAVVIFGKHTGWEMLYFLSKLNSRRAFERWHHKPVKVSLKEGVEQPVYYYSIRQFKQLMSDFQLVQKRPVGLFIPPSYLESLMEKKEKLFRKLVNLEHRFSTLSYFSGLADHMYLLFKKKVI